MPFKSYVCTEVRASLLPFFQRLCTPRKLYIGVMLLACTRTNMVGSTLPFYAVVGINTGEEKPECLFASYHLTGKEIYKALQTDTAYRDKVKELILYTERQPKREYLRKGKGTIIWSKALSELTENEPDKKRSYNLIASQKLSILDLTSSSRLSPDFSKLEIKDQYIISGEGLQEAQQMWYNKKKPTWLKLPKGRFANLYHETEELQKNNMILTIQATEGMPAYKVSRPQGNYLTKVSLLVQLSNQTPIPLIIDNAPHLTTAKVKQCLEEVLPEHKASNTKLFFRNRELKNSAIIPDSIKYDQEVLHLNPLPFSTSSQTEMIRLQQAGSKQPPNPEPLPDASLTAVTVMLIIVFYGVGLIAYWIPKEPSKKDLNSGKRRKDHNEQNNEVEN